MAFVYRAAFAVGAATAGAGASLMSTISPPCYQAPDESTNPSHHRHNERPGVTLQTVWDPTTRPRIPSRYLHPSRSPISSPSRSPPLSSTSSRSGEEALASAVRTAADDASPSDLEFALSTSRPLTVFTSLALEQLYNQRSELLQEVTQLQDALLCLDVEWEQAVRGRDRDIEELQTEHEEAKVAWKETHQKLDLSRVELAQLRENCDGLRAARDAAHNELRVVQDELRDTQDEVSCAQNELGGVQDELGGAQDELVSIQNELSSVQDDLLRAAAELSDVTSKRDACQAQLDAIRRSREEVSSELTTRKAELHQCTEAYRSEHGRLWDLRGEVGNLTKSLERTQQALSDAERRAKREEDDARARLSGLRGEIQKTEEVLAIRKKQAHDQHHRYSTLLAEVQSSLSAAKREKAHEIFRLEADANAVRDSIARLRNEDRIAKAELLRTHRSHEEANTALAVAVAQKEAAEVDAQAATVAAARSQGVARRAQESLASLKAQIQDAASLLEHTKTRSPPASQDFVSSLCTRADAEQSTPIAPPTPQASMPEQDGAPANHMPGSIDPPEHRPAPQDTGSGGLFNRLGGWIGRGSLSTPAAPPAASPTTKPPGHTHATPTSTPKNADVHAKVATRTHDGSKSEATSGLSETPDTRRTSSPARRSVSAAPGASKPGASAPAMVQEPSPTTVFSEASKDLASTPIILASQGASVRKSVPTPKSEQVRPNVAHPTSESHASQQRPPQDQALSPTSKTKSVPSPSDERAQSTASASLDNSGNEGVAAAITSHPEEPNAGAGLSSSSPTADTSKGRNKTSTPTDDETEGPTEATTKPATAESAESPGEAPPPLVELKAAKDESSITETAPASAPTQDATVASFVPPVESGDPQIASPPTADPTTDVQSKNDVSDKTSQLPVDAAVETSAPPYNAYPDDEIISFMPGGKVWPVVILEVILPSAHSKAPSDLDQRVTERSSASIGEQSVSYSVDSVDTTVAHPVSVSPTDRRRTNIAGGDSEDARIHHVPDALEGVAPSTQKPFWGSVAGSEFNPMASVDPTRPAPSSALTPRTTSASFNTILQQVVPDPATIVTPPTSPIVHKTSSLTSQPPSGTNAEAELDTSTLVAPQGPTPPMSSHEAPTTSTTKSIMRLASDTGTVMSPNVENAASKDIDPSADSHVSNQPPTERLSPALVWKCDSSALLLTDEELPAISESATTTKDGAAVAINNAAVKSGTLEVEIGAESSSEVAKADASDRQDEASITTEDETPGSTKARTHDTMNESLGSSGEAPTILGEAKAPEDEQSTPKVVPAPTLPRDAAAAPVVSPIVPAEPQIVEPQTDVQTKNNISDKASQVPGDAAVETPAPPYKAYPDDEIISFTPGAKVWPVVMLEVVLPSAYSKAPSDLDQPAAAPKGGKR